MLIVVPDDFPSVFENSEFHRAAQKLGVVRINTERGAENADELIRRIEKAEIVVNLRGYVQFSEQVINACPKLRMISIWGSGTDNVDLVASRRRDITVCNTVGLNSTTAAEHAFTLLLAAARHVPSVDSEMRKGGWPKDVPRQVHAKTLGVFGVGHVGSKVVKLALAFGMRVLAYSARGDAERVRQLGATPATKAQILRESDFVSLHLRLSQGTRGFLSEPEFAAMKPMAIVVNTARGHLIDKQALLTAISQGRIAGAGLDAFHTEPVEADDPILSARNVVFSPHIAGQSAEVRRAALLQVVANVENFLNGTPTFVVAP